MKTVATVVSNIRTRIKDTNASDYAVGSTRLIKLVSDMVLEIAGRLDVQGVEWETSVVTLASGDEDYSLATASGDYRAILAVRRAWDGVLLMKLTPEEMQARKNPESPITGEPEYYSLTETQATDPAQVVMIVDPVPTTAEDGALLDILTSYVPAEVDATTDEIPFSDAALVALELSVSVAVLSELTEEQVAKLGLNPAIAGRWDDQAASLLNREALRTYRQRRMGHIVQYGTS